MTVAYYSILTARNSREKPHFTHLPPCVVSLLIYFPLSFSFTDSHPLTSHFTFSLSLLFPCISPFPQPPHSLSPLFIYLPYISYISCTSILARFLAPPFFAPLPHVQFHLLFNKQFLSSLLHFRLIEELSFLTYFRLLIYNLHNSYNFTLF